MKKTNTVKGGKEYYRVVRVVGHKADGTAIRKEFYATGKKEAENKANEYLNKLKNGYSNDFEKVTVIELMKKWLFTIKRMQVKPSTFQTYEIVYRKYLYNSIIAGMQVCNVKKIQIQEYYNNMFDKKVTHERIYMINKVLHNFFEYCVEEGYLIKNPCHKIIIPKNKLEKTKEKEIKIFTPAEIERIKELFKGNKYEDIVYTAIYTGMREGEILALKWDNIHLDEGYIHVNESIKKVAIFDSEGNKEYQLVTSDPKTANSIRDIYIPKILINKLKTIPKTSDYVFTNNGEIITHKSLYFQWHKVLSESDIPYRKFHSLRHTYASSLLLNGVDLKTVQELMGHYDIKITQVYLHSLPDNKKKAVSIFDN